MHPPPRGVPDLVSLPPAGTPGTDPCFSPQNLTSFRNSTKSWVGFSGGQHHTVCMDSEGEWQLVLPPLPRSQPCGVSE